MSNDPTTKTALDLITGSLRKIGQYAPGETLSAEDAQDALDTFNGMLDIWSNQKMAIFNQAETVMTLTSGQAQYTIGVGQFFNTERPLRLIRAFSRVSNLDRPCDVVTPEKYLGIGYKAQPGPWPKMVYYNSGFPTGVLNFWPVPSSGVEMHIWSDAIFSSLALSDTVSLPRGYFLGLQYNLAELLCSEYGMAVPPDIRRFASQFRNIIKGLNATPQQEASVDGVLVGAGNDAGWVMHGGFQ